MNKKLYAVALVALLSGAVALVAEPVDTDTPSPDSFGIPSQPFSGVHCSGSSAINPVPPAWGGGTNITMYNCSGYGVPSGPNNRYEQRRNARPV